MYKQTNKLLLNKIKNKLSSKSINIGKKNTALKDNKFNEIED
jgi:hypothetical protein